MFWTAIFNDWIDNKASVTPVSYTHLGSENVNFTGEEKILMMLYSPGDRPGLYQALGEMRGQLEHDEKELRALTDRVMEKLEQMTEEAFDQLDLYSDI